MKLIVTGGCGFIGSHFVLRMLRHGHQVLNIDKLTYAASQSLFDLNSHLRQHSSYKFEKADIVEFDRIATIFEQFQPDAVVHFAAETHVDNSIDNPDSFIKSNVVGTYNLLRASALYYLEHKKKFKFVHISTDEVYGSLGDVGLFNELSPYDPKSPYSASKASSDHLVRAWSHTYGLPINITHCSNNFGPHQHLEKLIPKVIQCCVNGKTIPVYGDGTNNRDWIYVEDHCSALDAVLNSGTVGETYDIGAREEHDNNTIVEKICNIMDELYPNSYQYENLISYVTDRPGHDKRYSIDPSKIMSELSWEPEYEFERALTSTVAWYLDHLLP